MARMLKVNGTLTHSQASYDSPDLARLMACLAERDEVAMASLYDATASLTFGLILRIVRIRPLAEEVLVDVYHQIWQQAVRYEAERGRVTAWIMIIARSRAIDALRKYRAQCSRYLPDEDEFNSIPDRSPGPEHNLLLSAQRNAVHAAMAKLTEDQRQALRLAYFDGYTHTEIASDTQTPLGTVKSRIRTGLIELRAALAESP